MNLQVKTHLILDKQLSLAVKGLAIVMMLFHHCFGFPEYWLDEPDIPVAAFNIARNCKLCVAVFAFLSGFGFFVTGERPYRYTMKKVMGFLSHYWLQLFLIFLPIALVNYQFSPIKLFYNLFAVYDNIIVFAWYVFFYTVVLLTFPFYRRLLNGSLLTDLLIVVGGGYACVVILYFLPWESRILLSALMDSAVYYPVIGIGYITAKYDLFSKAAERMKHTLPGAVLILLGVVLLRGQISTVKGFSFDVFYAPLFVFAAALLLDRMKNWPLYKVFCLLGKLSFDAWLFHSLFFSAYTAPVVQPLVNWPSSVPVRFLLVAAFSFCAAATIGQLYALLGRIFRNLYGYSIKTFHPKDERH